MTNKQAFIQALINSLTDDEDIRQELWVHYLSDPHSPAPLENIHSTNTAHYLLQHRLGAFVTSPLGETAEAALSILAPIEKQVLYQLLLGRSIAEIARYNGIREIRVQRLIVSIQRSPRWNDLLRELNNAQEESN